MTRKPVDPVADANRALAIAVTILVLLAAVTVGVSHRGGDSGGPNSKLSVSPLPSVTDTEPQTTQPHVASKKRVAVAKKRAPKGQHTTTTLRIQVLGETCLVAFEGKKKPAADGDPTIPTITLPTLPPETTTDPPTTPPTEPPTTSATTPPTTPTATSAPPTRTPTARPPSTIPKAPQPQPSKPSPATRRVPTTTPTTTAGGEAPTSRSPVHALTTRRVCKR